MDLYVNHVRRFKVSLSEFDSLEMYCYCEHCSCEETMDYKHKDDWSNTEDWACQNCVKNCYKEEIE